MDEQFQAIGTHWNIRIYDELHEEARRLLLEEVHARIKEYEQTYSRFKDDSFTRSISGVTGMFTLPYDAEPLFDTYMKVNRLTNGHFTPLIGAVLEDAGYDATYSLRERQLQKPPQFADVCSYEYPNLTIHSPVRFDFGACGKGYLVDIVSSMLIDKKINKFVVDAGGDMYYHTNDHTPLRIGLENPDNSEEVIGVAHLVNRSICGSAGNRRRWGRFHHTIDPENLSSPEHLKAIWVLASHARIADALTTALYFVDPEVLRSEFEFSYVLLTREGSVQHSPDIDLELFVA